MRCEGELGDDIEAEALLAGQLSFLLKGLNQVRDARVALGVAGDADLADAGVGKQTGFEDLKAVGEGALGFGSSPPMRSTRCTPCFATASLRKARNSSSLRIRRADTCGTGSSPAARMAAIASSVRASGRPGSDGM